MFSVEFWPKRLFWLRGWKIWNYFLKNRFSMTKIVISCQLHFSTQNSHSLLRTPDWTGFDPRVAGSQPEPDVVRSQRYLGGVGVKFLTTLGVGVGFFVRLQMSNRIIILNRTPNLGIPVDMVQFLLTLLLKQRFLAVCHDFHWF